MRVPMLYKYMLTTGKDDGSKPKQETAECKQS